MTTTTTTTRWMIAGAAMAVLAGCEVDDPMVEARQSAAASGKLLTIGDSIMAATHSMDMCGGGKEITDCIENDNVVGHHDLAWSYAAGSHSWSLASRLGYSGAQVVNVADDGEEWDDAFDQAQALSPGNPEGFTSVVIGLGSNDVCQHKGHVYDQAQKAETSAEIDATLAYLTDNLGSGANIYLLSTPNIVQYRNALVNKRHNYMFKTCGDLWDLDTNEITQEAASSMCKGAGLGSWFCDWAGDASWVRNQISNLVDYFLEEYGVDEGPCGSVLASGANLAAAQAFNVWLNDEIAAKAAAYDGRNGVNIYYTDVPYQTTVIPQFVSWIDCFHPSRAGQMALANAVATGLADEGANIDATDTSSFYFDQFTNGECSNNGPDSFATCWIQWGDGGFDIREQGGWYRVAKDTSNKRNRWTRRHVGNLSGKTHMWLSFHHKRESLDESDEWVKVYIYKNGSYYFLDKFRGPSEDLGTHNGKYYDISGYISSDVRIMLQPQNGTSMKNGDRVKFDNFSVIAW